MRYEELRTRLDGAGVLVVAQAIADWFSVTLEDLCCSRQIHACGARWALWSTLHGWKWSGHTIARLFGSSTSCIYAGIRRHTDSGHEVTVVEPPVSPPARNANPEVSGTLMRLGPGDRRDDCQSYVRCLYAFERSTRNHDGRTRDPMGHCPRECVAFAPVPRHALIALASAPTGESDYAIRAGSRGNLGDGNGQSAGRVRQ